MFCKKCGSELAENKEFCGDCGEPIRVQDTISPKSVYTNLSPNTKRIIKLAIIGAFIGLAVTVAYLVIQELNGNSTGVLSDYEFVDLVYGEGFEYSYRFNPSKFIPGLLNNSNSVFLGMFIFGLGGALIGVFSKKQLEINS